MKVRNILLAAASFAFATSAFAGPFDGGFVGGQLKSNVKVDKITQSNASYGMAGGSQDMSIGSVDGGKALGNVELNVQAKDVTQTQKAYGLGYHKQQMNIGTLK